MVGAKHSASDLAQMQSLSLEAKVQMTKNRLLAWYEHWDGDVCLSFSGGKDSTVLKHIVDSMFDDVPSVFINTGLEYPEVRRFALAQKNVVNLQPEMNFREVVKRYGFPLVSKEVAKTLEEARRSLELNPNAKTYSVLKLRGELMDRRGQKSSYNCPKWAFLLGAPFKVSHRCCHVMKKNPARSYEKQTGRHPIVATLASESRMRLHAWLASGCNAFNATRPISKPMSFWTEQDVLRFIKDNGLEIAEVYGELYDAEDGTLGLTGVQRTGCMFCAFGAHLEGEPNRFQRMRETHPKQHEYCLTKLGMKTPLDFLGIPY